MNVREMNVRRDKSLLNLTESIAFFNHCPGLQSGVDKALINLGFSPISFSELPALFLEQIYTLFIVRVRYRTGYGWLATTGDEGLFALDAAVKKRTLTDARVRKFVAVTGVSSAAPDG